MPKETRLVYRHTPSFSPDGSIGVSNIIEENTVVATIADVTDTVRTSITGTCNIALTTIAKGTAELGNSIAEASESLPEMGYATGRTIHNTAQTIWHTAKGILGK